MRPVHAVLALALALALAGCGSRSPAATFPSRPASTDYREVRVREGDQISLRIFREPEMSGTFGVARDGLATLPRLGRIHVAGRTVVELQDSLRSALAVYLRNASVEVTVLRRVGVQGSVRKPDLYMIDLTMTLREVLALAGGVTEEGDPSRVTIIREGVPMRLAGGSDAGFVAADLVSGDQIVVGRQGWFQRNALAVVGTVAAIIPTVILILDRVGSDGGENLR